MLTTFKDFWEASGAAKIICDAFKELSKRVVERKGQKIILKMSKSLYADETKTC